MRQSDELLSSGWLDQQDELLSSGWLDQRGGAPAMELDELDRRLRIVFVMLDSMVDNGAFAQHGFETNTEEGEEYYMETTDNIRRMMVLNVESVPDIIIRGADGIDRLMLSQENISQILDNITFDLDTTMDLPPAITATILELLITRVFR